MTESAQWADSVKMSTIDGEFLVRMFIPLLNPELTSHKFIGVKELVIKERPTKRFNWVCHHRSFLRLVHIKCGKATALYLGVAPTCCQVIEEDASLRYWRRGTGRLHLYLYHLHRFRRVIGHARQEGRVLSLSSPVWCIGQQRYN